MASGSMAIGAIEVLRPQMVRDIQIIGAVKLAKVIRMGTEMQSRLRPQMIERLLVIGAIITTTSQTWGRPQRLLDKGNIGACTERIRR